MVYGIKNYTDSITLTSDNLVYIDQSTAENNSVTFTYKPKSAASVLVVGDFGSGLEAKNVFFENIFNTTLSQSKNVLYGIAPGLTSLDDYFTIYNSNISLEYNNKFDRIGTGSEVVFSRDGSSLESYTVLLFGDINGDGWYDAQDAVLAELLANGMLTCEQVGELAYLAADCNFDGAIDQADVELLNQAGALLSGINQTLPTKETLETAAYKEYSEFIVQAPTTDKTEDNTTEEAPTANNLWTVIMTYLEKILSFIFSLFKIA